MGRAAPAALANVCLKASTLSGDSVKAVASETDKERQPSSCAGAISKLVVEMVVVSDEVLVVLDVVLLV